MIIRLATMIIAGLNNYPSHMKSELKLPNSPMITARADTSIGECVRRMRDAHVGSVVVVSDDRHEDLLGMFTERDLLKNVELIHRGKFWDRAVRTVMTKTVRYVTSENLDDAARLMLKYKVRHIPVVQENGERRHVIGVFSMRDLFQNLMERYAHDLIKALLPVIPENTIGIPSELGVLTRDAALGKFLKDGFAATPNILIKRISPRYMQNQGAMISGLYHLRSLIFDIDNLKFDEWKSLLAKINADKSTPHVIVVYDPEMHPKDAVHLLTKLKDSKKFTVLSKPIDLGHLFRQISTLLTTAP